MVVLSLQANYVAFAKVYLAQRQLSASSAQSCLQHAKAMCAAINSEAPAVHSAIGKLRALEFLVSGGKFCPVSHVISLNKVVRNNWHNIYSSCISACLQS